MIKYSIILPYYRRATQLHNTLISFLHHYQHRDDYEVIIVEDLKNLDYHQDHLRLLEIISNFKNSIDIVYCLNGTLNTWSSPTHYNFAVSISRGIIMVLTTPECFHVNNILRGFDLLFELNSHIHAVCACLHWHNYNEFIGDYKSLGGSAARWYQHSVLHNVQYHFCAAMSLETWNIIEPWDETYQYGLSYDDNDLLERLKKNNILIASCDHLLVKHLEHENFIDYCPSYRDKIFDNRKLFFDKYQYYPKFSTPF